MKNSSIVGRENVAPRSSDRLVRAHVPADSFKVSKVSWVRNALRIEVRTDLPDGTGLDVGIAGEKTGKNIVSVALESVTVSGGQFVSDGFATDFRDGKPFRAGRYWLTIKKSDCAQSAAAVLPITIPIKAVDQEIGAQKESHSGFNTETSWIGDVLHIRVATDAPDGTSFTAFIADRKTSEWISDSNFNDPDYSSKGYKWAVTVKNGQFVADGFTREGKPFSPGRYMLMLDCGALDRVQIPITMPPRSKEQRKVTTAHVDASVGCEDMPKEGIAGHLNSDGEYVPNSNEAAKNDAQHAEALADDNVGVIHGANGVNIIPVGVDEKAYDEFTKAIVNHDKEGMDELVSTGRVFVAQDGTRVRILDRGVFTTEVRVLGGPHEGQRGIVSSSLITF